MVSSTLANTARFFFVQPKSTLLMLLVLKGVLLLVRSSYKSKYQRLIPSLEVWDSNVLMFQKSKTSVMIFINLPSAFQEKQNTV